MLGSFIWAERRRRGWPRAELARRAGCSADRLALLECGRIMRVDGAFVARLAAALGLPVEALERAAGPQLRRAHAPERDPGAAPTRGALVRAARRRRGWTQAQLGRRVGLGQAAISAIERGGAVATRRNLWARLAAALELPLDGLEEAARQ